MGFTREQCDQMWADYANGVGVAQNREEAREIMHEWMRLNPWFDDRYNSEKNQDLILAEMALRNYKVALISITAVVSGLFGRGLLKHAPKSEEETLAPKIVQTPTESGDSNDPLLIEFAKNYQMLPAMTAKLKYGQDKQFHAMFDRCVAAKLI